MNCKCCNGLMQVDKERRLLICPYCNNEEPFDSLTKEEMKEIVDDAIEEVKVENKKMVDTIVKAHKNDLKEQEKSTEFAKTAMLIMLIIFEGILFIMIAMCADLGYIPALIVAIIQFILVLMAIFFRVQSTKYGKVKYSKIATICTVVPVFLVLIWLLALGMSADGEEETTDNRRVSDRVYDWPTTDLGSTLPHLNRKHPDYCYTYDNTFKADLYDCDRGEYEDYVKACMDAGYTLEAITYEKEYYAYDEAGNRLKLNYISNQETLYIELQGAMKMESLYWPTQGIAKELPAPDSEVGVIQSMTTTSFEVYVGEMGQEKFLQYINACMEAGFEGRYEQNSDKFFAEKGTLRLSIENRHNDIVKIYIYDTNK